MALCLEQCELPTDSEKTGSELVIQGWALVWKEKKKNKRKKKESFFIAAVQKFSNERR